MSCVIKITGGTKQYARKVGSQRTKATNKSSLISQIDHMKDKLDTTQCIVLVHKSGCNQDDPTHR